MEPKRMVVPSHMLENRVVRQAAARQKAQLALLELLTEHEEGLTTPQIVAAALDYDAENLNSEWVYDTLDRLARQGKVVKSGKARAYVWSIAPLE